MDNLLTIQEISRRSGVATSALRFYEARGFRAICFTDGADNEEKMPDVRYRWQRT